jgi:hypothetical protein
LLAMETVARKWNSERAAGMLLLAATVAIVLLPRLAFVATGAHFAGDSHAYALVAQNILDHLCVSMSEPQTGTCAAHWGGNQLPGYPAFVAAVWAVAGPGIKAPLVAQSLVTSLFAVYLISTIAHSGYGRRAAWLAAVVVGLSPSLVGWSRTFLTEGLAIALSLWVLAEVLRSDAEARLRVWPLGFALAAGLFVRYDFLIVAIPVCVAAFVIHRPRIAGIRLLGVALIVVMPYGAWTVRSVAHDLPILPPFGVMPSGEVAPPGVLDWIGTWIADQGQLPTSIWAIVSRDYEALQSPEGVLRVDGEAGRVDVLLGELRVYQGRSVPPELDARFAALAAEWRTDHRFAQWFVLPARRAANMWGSPFPGLGWPSALPQAERTEIREAIRDDPVRGVGSAFAEHPLEIILRGIVTGYRYLVLTIVVVLAVLCLRNENQPIRLVVGLAVLYALTRTLLFSQTLLIETRYLIVSLAWLDVACAVGVAHLWSVRSQRNATSSSGAAV